LKPIVLAIALAILVPSAFAADNTSSRRYGTSEALSVQHARLGEVLMVRPVQLKSDKKVNAGSAIGAAVGYGAARKVNGDYRNAARVASGVIGGVAGTAIQNGFSGRRAVEIYVRDVSDKRQRIIAIVQDADVDVREGDQVFLVGKGSKTRVVPIPPPTLVGSIPGIGGVIPKPIPPPTLVGSIPSVSGESKLPSVACGRGGCTNSNAEDGTWNGTSRSSRGQDTCGLMCPDGYEVVPGCLCASISPLTRGQQ